MVAPFSPRNAKAQIAAHRRWFASRQQASFDDRARKTVADAKDNAIIVKELPHAPPALSANRATGECSGVAGPVCFTPEEFYL
jgi:hypothetical protein